MEKPKRWNIRWPSRRGQRLVLAAALVPVLVGILCAFLRISRPRDIEAFLGMAAECHPVWKQFALRRYGAGDSAPELFRRFPPTRRMEFDSYGVYLFSAGPSDSIPFTSLTVVARNGKLLSASAGSCTWQFTFFYNPDPEFDLQYAAFEQARHRKLLQRRLEELEAQIQKFYGQQGRWPTNEAEFGWFVTGEKPSAEQPVTKGKKVSTAEEEAFKARYGLGEPSPRANPLGITFKFGENGALTIALNGEPGLVGTVAKPSQ